MDTFYLTNLLSLSTQIINNQSLTIVCYAALILLVLAWLIICFALGLYWRGSSSNDGTSSRRPHNKAKQSHKSIDSKNMQQSNETHPYYHESTNSEEGDISSEYSSSANSLNQTQDNQEDVKILDNKKIPIEGSSNISRDLHFELLAKYPILWTGILGIKSTETQVQLHYISGNRSLIQKAYEKASHRLLVHQRLKNDLTQLTKLEAILQVPESHCIALALPSGIDSSDVLKQNRLIRGHFNEYLVEKNSVAIVKTSDSLFGYITHIFPMNSQFGEKNLNHRIDDMQPVLKDIQYLLLVIVKIHLKVQLIRPFLKDS